MVSIFRRTPGSDLSHEEMGKGHEKYGFCVYYLDICQNAEEKYVKEKDDWLRSGMQQ